MYASVTPTGCGKTPGLKAMRAANATAVHHSNPFYLAPGGAKTSGSAAAVVPVADSLNAFMDTRLDRTRRSAAESYRSERKRQADRAREFTARNLEHVIYDAPVEYYSGRPEDPAGAAREAFQKSVEEQNMRRRTPRHTDAAKHAPPPIPLAKKKQSLHQISHVDEIIFGRDFDASGHLAPEAAPRKSNISHLKSSADEVIFGRDLDASRASTPKAQTVLKDLYEKTAPEVATPRASTPRSAVSGGVAPAGAATPRSAGSGVAEALGATPRSGGSGSGVMPAGYMQKRYADSREATPRSGTPKSETASSKGRYEVQMRSGVDEILFGGRDIDYSGPVKESGEKHHRASIRTDLPAHMRSGADEAIFGRDIDQSGKMM